VPTQVGGYEGYYAELVTALVGGTPPPVTIEEAIAVMVVIEAAQLSARTHRTVSL
jgi:predicted dehydrogenase